MIVDFSGRVNDTNPPYPFCRDEHLLISSMTSIMINILNESEEAFQQLLEVILQNLIMQKKVRSFLSFLIFLILVYIYFS